MSLFGCSLHFFEYARIPQFNSGVFATLTTVIVACFIQTTQTIKFELGSFAIWLNYALDIWIAVSATVLGAIWTMHDRNYLVSVKKAHSFYLGMFFLP
jgi:hypothetical protein